MEQRDSFIVLKNWAGAIEALPEEYQLETYRALMQYGLNGEIPQDIPAVVNAMLISFSVGMENNIARYNASVENGKKGGRPKKEETQENPEEPNHNLTKPSNNLEKPNKTQQNPTITQNNPSETQQNLTKPNHNLNVNVNVNDNVNVFSQSINTHMRTCEIKPQSEEARRTLKKKFNDFWIFGITPERNKLGFEVIDVILEALSQARSEERLVYNGTKYNFNEFYDLIDKLDDEDLSQIVWSLQNNQEIKNRPYYILGCLINRGLEKEHEKHIAR